MRCPICVRYSCICAPGTWDREVRKSFDDAAKWAAAAREQREHSSPLAPVAADPGGTETKPEQNLHEKESEG